MNYKKTQEIYEINNDDINYGKWQPLKATLTFDIINGKREFNNCEFDFKSPYSIQEWQFLYKVSRIIMALEQIETTGIAEIIKKYGGEIWNVQKSFGNG